MLRRAIVFSACAMVASASTAKALTIVLTDTGSTPMTAAQLSAFNAAADIWEGIFTDPITVNINIEFASLGSGILGSTQTRRTTHSYSSVRTAMIADATVLFSSEDTVTMMLPATSVPLQDINGARTDTSITLSSANAKALALGTGADPVYGTPPAGGADARIQFATAFASSFDFDRTNGITAGKTDFVTVAAHEIGHAMGFFSVTDVQDGNAGLTLHANTLDLWRFNQTGGAHNIGTENRKVTAGPAEYYDTVLNNRQFSRGVTVSDSLCNTFSGTCQASHWRDSLGNLMDPTIGTGTMVDPLSDDKHAIDYIGYNRPFLLAVPWKFFLIKWFPFPPPPDFPKDPIFDRFPIPPDPKDIRPPGFKPNLTAQIAMDLGVPGLNERSGVGFALFTNAMTNPDPKTIEFDKPTPGEENLNPPVPPLLILPRMLNNFYFESEDTAGMKFRFFDTFSMNGAQYDSSLGRFGGYRVTGFLDGDGDRIVGDIDGFMTLLLLADKSTIPTPDDPNIFSISPGSGEDSLQLIDPVALGITLPQWGVDGGGKWGDPANWIGGVPDGPGAIAGFLGKLTQANAPAVITLNGDRTVGTLVFDNDNTYSIVSGPGGGSLILNNNGGIAQVSVLSGKQEIGAPLVAKDSATFTLADKTLLTLSGGFDIGDGKSVAKNGAGILDISKGMRLGTGASFTVNDGPVNVDHIRGGTLIVRGGARFNVKPDGGNGGASLLIGLLFDGVTDAWQGKVDLTNNDLVVQSTAADRLAVLAETTNKVKTARNLGPGGLWSGEGLTSSTAANFPKGITGLAVILNQGATGGPIYQIFDGLPVDTNSILVKFTYNGDANADGKVDAVDYFQIDLGFIKGLTGYANGDFDYSEKTDANDYFLIDNAFLLQGGALEASSAIAAVPEPGAVLSLLSIGILASGIRSAESAGPSELS